MKIIGKNLNVINLYNTDNPKSSIDFYNVKNDDKIIEFPCYIPYFSNINFCGKYLSKAKYGDLDFFVIEQFKIPIEKFETVDAMHNYLEDEYSKLINSIRFDARSSEVEFIRRQGIIDWKYMLQDVNYPISLKYVAMNSILKDLSPKNDSIQLKAEKIPLLKTKEIIDEILSNDRRSKFDFKKIYHAQLRKYYFGKDNVPEKFWMEIPTGSQTLEEEKYNLHRMQSLSSPKWCLSNDYGQKHFYRDRIFMYFENEYPKACLLVDKNSGLAYDFDDALNTGVTSKEYTQIISDFISKNKFKTSDAAEKRICQVLNLKTKE